MLRLVDIVEQNSDNILFRTEEITAEDIMPYVIYDTSTGTTSPDEDYPAWRATTTETATGADGADFSIDNTNLYPSYITNISDYTALNPRLFKVMSLIEYQMLHSVLVRFDLVRKRLPNPGITIDSTDGIGQDGAVSFAGGFEKKMTIGEVMLMMAGTIVEVNGAPPRTSFWPAYHTTESDKINNPYFKANGIPNDMVELVQLGTLIRCLISQGIMEVDIHFNTSDSGLQLTFDRAGQIKTWYDSILAEYKDMKSLFKWNHANHGGVGVGTVPFSAMGIWGTLMNNASYGGTLAVQTVLGFSSRGNVPM